MTSLLIATNNAYSESVSIETDKSTFSVFYPWQNVLNSQNGSLFATINSQTSVSFIYNFANPFKANYIAIANIYKLLGKSIEVFYSMDKSTWTSAFSETLSAKNTAYDYYKIFTEQTYQYWKITFSSLTSFNWQIGHISFGELLDLGLECESFQISYQENTREMQVFSGACYIHNRDKPRLGIDFVWNGVSDAKAQLFESQIMANNLEQTYFLIAQTYNKVLAGNYILHCSLKFPTRLQNEVIDDFNKLTLTAEQTI